ncbi:iron complex transport system substrate-binding protein [Gillisia sp. Hel1_33_143]|uniref:ABC transporter substrate-binding protein n=1 Tax=Gillisia sp. Hel1_33_143 TaxID=1336796 RepID=UPI0008798386|nr:ABC transporter substrate-binding protein [Gillisia sp. Hel1_33_143]SDS49282.1 iron complex transport system substrate-binding protein [Gillisia sp. Hel1_33_143]
MRPILILFISLLFLSCKNEEKNEVDSTSQEIGESLKIENAHGFTISKYNGYKILTITDPWPNAEKSFKYLLVEDESKVPSTIEFDKKINIPIKRIVLTSTTHIPSLEALDETEALIGFPGLDYISSETTRALIAENKIVELGKNEAINTEILITLEPDLVIGFAIDGNNKTYNTIEKSGIPVIFNGDWTEESPLGKAEWIKFFGALFDKSEEAEEIYDDIAKNYKEAKQLAQSVDETPLVIAGSMYKDSWFVPYGNSWQAQFIKDANASYIYKDTEGSGSKALSFESVLNDAQNADFWVAPGQFQSYEQLYETSQHYKQFKAVQNKKVFTYSNTMGATGGVLYYELAPNRPDLVLKDLISIFHPELLKDYKPTFFKPLD